MNGTVIFGAIAMFFVISGLVNFVNDLHDDVDSRSNYHESKESYNEKYYSYNSIGERMIILNSLSEHDKMDVWNNSSIKTEMIKFFPSFSLMRETVEEKIVDDSNFKLRLLKKIDTVEEKYIAGTLTGESAKASLSFF